ncbi:MAG: hypothetical protein IH842_01465 [Thaumarchaeota archaeon]|nr:hypothetical protein [Nitrososphaerota archaeon]
MTKKITLESKIEQFSDALNDGWMFGDYRYGIPDFKVMQKLGCTPQSWARYRPKIIQYCLSNDLIKTEVRDGIEIETVRICIRYDKKAKEWYGKNNPLMLDDKEQHTWREMTQEELDKYNIIWYADEFMH